MAGSAADAGVEGFQLAAPCLAVRLLGNFRLLLRDVDARPRSRKAAGLLAFLAVAESRSAPRARLADLLWGDRAEEQARSSLRQAIVELRASPAGAAGAIVVTRDTIALARDALRSDIDDVHAAARRRDGATLAGLLERVDGAFLADMHGLSPAFDDWLTAERVRQEERLLAVVIEAVPDMMARPAIADTRRILSALERIDPLNERVVGLRLRLDSAAGDVAAMHRRFRRLTEDLARDLGVAPSGETRELFAQLLAAASDSGHAVPPAARPEPRTPPAVLVTGFVPDGSAESGNVAAICSEDIRMALARNGELRVLAIDAVDDARAQSAIGNAIAAYRLSGSVRMIGGVMQFNVELGNIASGLVTWSEQIRLAARSLELIDTVVARVVGAVGPAVERDIAGSIALDAPPSGALREAALLYAHGRRLVREARTLAAAREGAESLEAALRQDPRHVGARMRLAQLYNTDFSFRLAGHDVARLRTRALLLIEEAAALDPGNVRVQLRRAWCHLRRNEWPAAERLFRGAATAIPHDADALNECAFGLACLGELTMATDLMQRAFQLNPFAPIEYHADHAVLLALAGDARAAEDHFAVCGERRLLYQAVRLGNLIRLDRDDAQLDQIQREFVDEFMAIWQRRVPPSMADLAEWVDHTLCLRRQEHRRLVLDGIEAAWRPRSAAGRGRTS